MNRKTKVLQQLEEHRDEIRRFGVRRLALFGSTARGEQGERSDLDFLVEFEKKSFDAYMDLKNYLEELFNCRVDLVLPNTIKPRLKNRILSETVDVPGL
ncbi:MAG TPA: nucleotidyltransferase family protein [Acidobacteriota bacterium]|nr:nucleotidyltransferase family protein [Acidobacteriota bacterium]